ncbi:MAG: ABC transporter ATP-binding protein [Oscillochloris sp.]|nr:ABC transporter ATP-binding protein [Oscillochloris sp.]
MSVNSASAIAITNLTKTYRGPDGTAQPILNLPQLQMARGSSLAISGPSGSGKTTLLHIVAGLLQPSSGDVLVLGEALTPMSEATRDRFRARNIGYIFQTSNLLAGFSALENMLLAMGFAGNVPTTQRRARASELLERVGLAARMHHRPNQLSSGQQQRVAIARAVANRPSLILADEPTAHVDYPTGCQVIALLREICAEHGAALLLASHDRELLAEFPTRLDLREKLPESSTHTH